MTAEATQIMEELKEEMRRLSSPWLDRQGAADFAQCSVVTIDRAAAAGKFKTYRLGADPRFKRTDVNKWIESES